MAGAGAFLNCTRVVVPCIVLTLPGRRKNPCALVVGSRLLLASAGDRSRFTSMCSFVACRGSTLHLVGSLACSDFVAGAVNRGES